MRTIVATIIMCVATLAPPLVTPAAGHEQYATPGPPTLADELKRISALHGVVFKGIEKTRAAPLRAAEGDVRERLKILLSDFNYVTFYSSDGTIEVVITSSRTVARVGPRGEAVTKALDPTPVDGARVSSGYGMRLHPILGYSMMHRGVDFQAAAGAPVYAAGDGVVVTAGRCGAYGKCVLIRHDSTYETVYAHLSGFAAGIHRGGWVKRRELIGYVGSTGRSTGPHLHFEVRVNGEQVDPESVKLPTGHSVLAGFRRLST